MRDDQNLGPRSARPDRPARDPLIGPLCLQLRRRPRRRPSCVRPVPLAMSGDAAQGRSATARRPMRPSQSDEETRPGWPQLEARPRRSRPRTAPGPVAPPRSEHLRERARPASPPSHARVARPPGTLFVKRGGKLVSASQQLLVGGSQCLQRRFGILELGPRARLRSR